MLINRHARPAPAIWNVTKTIVLTAIASGVLVGAVPQGILALQHHTGEFDALFFPPQVVPGEVIFLGSTLLVLWAAITLAIKGAGTPFWFDGPRNLVIGGPYAWLRTPMVSGTVMQGIGIGLIYGSLAVVLFSFLLALLWNTFVRPAEEAHLQSVFGRSFELYRRSVRCWLPMRMPWRGPVGDVRPITLEDMPNPNRRRKRR